MSIKEMSMIRTVRNRRKKRNRKRHPNVIVLSSFTKTPIPYYIQAGRADRSGIYKEN